MFGGRRLIRFHRADEAVIAGLVGRIIKPWASASIYRDSEATEPGPGTAHPISPRAAGTNAFRVVGVPMPLEAAAASLEFGPRVTSSAAARTQGLAARGQAKAAFAGWKQPIEKEKRRSRWDFMAHGVGCGAPNTVPGVAASMRPQND